MATAAEIQDPVTTLAAWAVPEAYRVTRLPSSHGGVIGWQFTLWRYRVLVEAWRTGQTVVRECYAPDPVIRDHAWELFDTFGALHPPRWMPWRRVSF